MTSRGALAAMVAGFFGVPFFKFVGPHLPVVGRALGALEELAPAFALGAIVAVVVSRFDPEGRARLAGIEEELDEAAS
jgi:Na+/proline symporter